ncbi:hypothetical protein GCM10008941_01800 [Rhizomicrobium palustre]
MRLTLAFALAPLALVPLALVPLSGAAAQSVTVNSMGVNADGQVLIDPGTGQPRALPPLLQPWQYNEKPIVLHMPRARAKVPATDTAVTPPASESYAAAPVETPKPKKHKAVAAAAPVEPAPVAREMTEEAPKEAPKPKKIASAKPAPQTTTPPAPKPAAPAPQSAASSLSGFGDLQTLTMAPANKPAPAPQKAAQQAPRPAPQPAPQQAAPQQAAVSKPVQTASIEPAKSSKAKVPAGSRRDTVTFAPNASDPSASAVSAIRTLANSLGDVAADGSARIQLLAYAGQRGEKTSDTRRMSLKRALVVRQLLIDDGIPSEKIDVFAHGGVDDNGPLDRVDVMVTR